MYKRIIAPVDGSETSRHALDAALELARDHDAELNPVYVVDVPPLSYSGAAFDPTPVRDAFVAEGEHVLADAAAKMKRYGVRGTTSLVEVEPLADDIAQRIEHTAQAFDADLVVMGTHGRRGWRRLLLGSVTEHFLRISTRPVLLVPHHPPPQTEPDVPGVLV
ncbi:universal stress protein [Caballeronia sp. dw_276]|jgi:nucleotide-binding universal stress UspA family protein|uniref:universal stress protein n=1 Tax=Caballeronia sp. dw_276 TaxID=2719795 RepID=UPI001BD5F7E0|nr:universal stress protein [Caballeronia sp. dw_276]